MYDNYDYVEAFTRTLTHNGITNAMKILNDKISIVEIDGLNSIISHIGGRHFNCKRDIVSTVMTTLHEFMRDNKIIPNQETYRNLLQATAYGSMTPESLFDMGLRYSDDILEISCQFLEISLVQQIIDNKVNPSKKCFDCLFYDIDVWHPLNNKTYRHNKDQETVTKINKIVRIFISNGYLLTYEDVVVATKKRVIIDMVDSSDIKLDDKFRLLCSELKMYQPYKNIIKSYTIESFTALIQMKPVNMREIKEYIKKGVVPTQECLEIACKYFNGRPLIKLLLDSGLDMNIKCVGLVIKHFGNSRVKWIFQEYQHNVNAINKQKPIEKVTNKKHNAAIKAKRDSSESDDEVIENEIEEDE